MIRKLIVIGIAVLLTLPELIPAKEIAGIQIPESLDQTEIPLVLNGAGIRSRFFMDIYISALYLTIRSQDAEKILRDDAPMGIRLYIVSSLIGSGKLKKTIAEGFENATGGNIQPIKTQIDRFMATMNEKITKGDTFDFIYLPQTGVKIYKNGTFKDDIKGLNFKRAFFGIWLGDDPADEDLKNKLLGF